MALITSANARQMNALGWQARRKRDEQLRQTIATLVQSPQLDYHNKRLARVRAQLDRLDSELEKCSLSDSKRIKELTDAQLRLSEQERILAGRPLPGSRKPLAEKASKDIGPGAWIAEPAPIPVAPIQPALPASPCCPCVPPTSPEPQPVVVPDKPETTSAEPTQ